MNASNQAAPMETTPHSTPPPDRQAFSILAREHHRSLLAYARALASNHATAEDLVQDAFVTAWRNLGRFEVTRDFGSWLRGIVRNKWREHLRRHAREVDVDDETLEAWESRFSSAEQSRQDGRGELFESLDDCLRRLPTSMLDAVQGFYYQEKSCEQIATASDIDVVTLRKRLQRARLALHDCLSHKLQLAH